MIWRNSHQNVDRTAQLHNQLRCLPNPVSRCVALRPAFRLPASAGSALPPPPHRTRCRCSRPSLPTAQLLSIAKKRRHAAEARPVADTGRHRDHRRCHQPADDRWQRAVHPRHHDHHRGRRQRLAVRQDPVKTRHADVASPAATLLPSAPEPSPRPPRPPTRRSCRRSRRGSAPVRPAADVSGRRYAVRATLIDLRPLGNRAGQRVRWLDRRSG